MGQGVGLRTGRQGSSKLEEIIEALKGRQVNNPGREPWVKGKASCFGVIFAKKAKIVTKLKYGSSIIYENINR